jgi:hypothetical protein
MNSVDRGFTGGPGFETLGAYINTRPAAWPRPARPGARPAAAATPGWPAPSATSPPARHAPTPSWAPTTDASRDGAARRKLVATGNTVLTIVYHLLADPDAQFRDLGADHYDSRINKERRARAAQLQAATGHTIRIRNGKAVIINPEAA